MTQMGKDFWVDALGQLTYVSDRDKVQLQKMDEAQLRLIEELLHRQAVKLNARTPRDVDPLRLFVREIYALHPEVCVAAQKLHGERAYACWFAVMRPQHVNDHVHIVVHDARLKAQARALLMQYAPTITNVNHPNSVLAIVSLQ